MHSLNKRGENQLFESTGYSFLYSDQSRGRNTGPLDLGHYKNEGLGPSPPNGAEFHQGLIMACRIEADRHVLGVVLVDEEHAPEQDPLGIEGWISGPVGTDVGGLLLLP